MDITPEKTAFIFPGQGSQTVGMGQELASNYPAAKEVFLQANEILSFELSALAWNGNEDELNDTVNTQPALLTHSVAALRVLEQFHPEFQPRFVAGHSLGELSALVASGALKFPDALVLTRKRGEFMKEAGLKNPGGMAAILGMDIPTVENLCEQASTATNKVQVANDNCGGQVVVSGERKALEKLLPLARAAGARKVVPLPVSIAAHSYLMEYAQSSFNEAVDNAGLRDPDIPIIGNVQAIPMTQASEIRDDLKAQLTSRVRWTESIQYMGSQGVDTYLEIGTGDVLCTLIKRIDRKTKRIPLGTPEDFTKFMS